jgi:hypothetical protein
MALLFLVPLAIFCFSFYQLFLADWINRATTEFERIEGERIGDVNADILSLLNLL